MTPRTVYAAMKRTVDVFMPSHSRAQLQNAPVIAAPRASEPNTSSKAPGRVWRGYLHQPA